MSEKQEVYVTDALEMIGLAEPKQIVTEISGFVPVFEVVLHHYKDYVTALVFGRMWQYCGMSDGVCRASLDKIANDLEMSAATVMRHAEKLTTDGFLIDTTPERRNAPHEYVDGRRVEMKGRFSAGIAQRNATVSQRNATVSESQLIKQDNTKITQPAGVLTSKEVQQVNDKVDAILAAELKPLSIREAMKSFPFNVKWDSKQAREFMEWVVADGITPEQIARAAEIWRSDKQFNWQVPSLTLVFQKWPALMQAMGGAQSESPHPEYKPYTPEDDSQFVPRPK